MPPAEVATRLCVCHSVPQYRQLAAGLLSFWEYDEEALPSNVAKDMVRLLKASDAQHLPGIYLGAMQASYHRCKVSAQEYDPEEFDDELRAYEFAMAPFLRLSLRIAQSQAAFNAPVATLAYVAEEGAKWALEQAPERLDFLDGTVYFATRLKGEAASAVLAAVEAAGTAAGAPALDAKGNDDEEVEAWANYHAYCEHLSQQVAKGAGSGLRGKSKARSKAGQQRRISFAPGVEGSDEEDANADGGAVGVEEAPAVSTAARMKAQRVQRAARATRRRRGGDEEMAEEEGEDDEVDVMPTEEQLPGMRPAAAAVQQPGSDEDSDGEEEHQVRRRRRR